MIIKSRISAASNLCIVFKEGIMVILKIELFTLWRDSLQVCDTGTEIIIAQWF